MQIIDLTEEHKQLYFVCLEDWSDEIKEAVDHKARWYERMKDKGLRVKLALDDSGTIGAMIQYAPIKHSPVLGENLYYVYCIWVHGHKNGRGNFQKRGMGKALIAAAEDDVMISVGLLVPGHTATGPNEATIPSSSLSSKYQRPFRQCFACLSPIDPERPQHSLTVRGTARMPRPCIIDRHSKSMS